MSRWLLTLCRSTGAWGCDVGVVPVFQLDLGLDGDGVGFIWFLSLRDDHCWKIFLVTVEFDCLEVLGVAAPG